MNDLAEAKARSERAYAMAETEYHQSYGAFRAAHSAAIAELVTARPPESEVLDWLHARTGDARDRLAAAEEELARTRIEVLAVDAAIAAQREASLATEAAAKAARDSVRYADELAEVNMVAESAFLLASKSWMQLNPDIKAVEIKQAVGKR